MARRLLAVLLVSLVSIPASAATAAPTSRTLTVRGVPNAYAEVMFAGRVRFETATKSRPSYDAKGTYAGAYVERVRGDGPVAGTVLLRAMPSLSDVPFPLGPQGWLPPGRYRVHLIGDAPTTVKIRVEGLRRNLTITTKTRANVVAKWISRGMAGVATPADRTIVPFTVRSRTLTVVAEAHESTGFYGQRDVCVRERTNGLSPCLDGNSGHARYSGVYPIRWTMGGAAAYHPGALPLGELEAEFLDVAVAVPHGLTTFVMTLN
ncbi:MAG TPA: hypothetical protein VNQ77_01540 [Frankiaceae bacterium]|nr:hypothetical protein [Frankiaceae bacterium]